MRYLLICGMFLHSVLCLKAQRLTFFYDRDLFIAENVCDVNHTFCDSWKSLTNGTANMLGYAHHPSGQLWLVIDELYDPEGYHRIKIIDADIEKCQFKLLYTINLLQYWAGDATIVVDIKGSLYLNISEWDAVNNTSIRTVSRIADPSQPVIERLLVKAPGQIVYEMLFLNQKIYMLDLDKPYIRVYNTDFDIIDTIITQKHIYGITAINHGCDSTTIYVGHSQYNTYDFWSPNMFDSTLYIANYNLETNTLTEICDYWMGENTTVPQLTSPLEFLASDPECDLLIDLDRDNSTGVYPYDYLDSNIYCTMLEVPVSDEDTYIHTSAPLDSIRLILSGIIDINEERLIMQPIPAGINFTMVDDSTYLITSSNPTDSLYSEAIRAIYYQHNGISLSDGTRTIIIQGFNDIKAGVLVKSSIRLEGSDKTFLYSTTCMSSEVGTFVTNHLNQNGCDSLVTLTVSLVPADTTTLFLKTCDPAQIGSVETHYLNQEGCDSLVIQQTTLHPISELIIEVTSNFNGYAISCYGERDGAASAEGDGAYPWIYLWSNGSTDQSISGLTSGSYEVTITDANGCTFSGEVELDEPEIFSISFIVSEPKCFDSTDGSITVKPSGGVEPIQYSINNLGYQDSPLFNSLKAGTFTVSAIDANGCETKEIIWINVPLELNVNLGEDEIINSGDVAILNAIVNVPFDSLSEISWSGLINPVCPNCLSQPVAPIITTTYSVVISNHVGCIDKDSLTLFVQYANDIYIPNIFTPNGDGINDLLLVYGGSGVNQIASFEIFNRWGTLVYSVNNFQSDDLTQGWDGKMNGKDLNPDVFTYRAIVEFKDGSSVVRYGDITLVR